jgi:anti-sigma B factor antagonist
MPPYSTREVDGVTIVDLTGDITLGEGSAVLRDLIRDLLAAGHKRIVLNLRSVNFIDSTGIGELMSALVTTRKENGELKLLNPTSRTRELLETTKLDTVFEVYDHEASAVRLGRAMRRNESRPRSRRD